MRKRLFTLALALVLLMAALTGCSSSKSDEAATSSTLQVVVAAPFATEEQANALRDALNSEEISVTYVASGDPENDPMGAMAGLTQITAKLASDELELLLCDADNARRHGDNGETYIPLSELFTEEEIAELGIVPATLPVVADDGTITEERTEACGVDLSGNATLTQMLNISDLGAYVIVESPNLESAKAVIKSLLAM